MCISVNCTRQIKIVTEIYQFMVEAVVGTGGLMKAVSVFHIKCRARRSGVLVYFFSVILLIVASCISRACLSAPSTNINFFVNLGFPKSKLNEEYVNQPSCF